MDWFYVIFFGAILYFIWLREAEYNLDAYYKEHDRKLKAKQRREEKKRERELTPEEIKENRELLKELEKVDKAVTIDIPKTIEKYEKKILDITLKMKLVKTKHSREYVSLEGEREKLIKEKDDLLKFYNSALDKFQD